MPNVERIWIESDERGFELWIETDEDEPVCFNVHGCAIALMKAVDEHIRPWWEEGEKVQREFLSRVFRCDPDESGGYEPISPKHPHWHSIHADLYDQREGK